jgi:hypothetical protein
MWQMAGLRGVLVTGSPLPRMASIGLQVGISTGVEVGMIWLPVRHMYLGTFLSWKGAVIAGRGVTTGTGAAEVTAEISDAQSEATATHRSMSVPPGEDRCQIHAAP